MPVWKPKIPLLLNYKKYISINKSNLVEIVAKLCGGPIKNVKCNLIVYNETFFLIFKVLINTCGHLLPKTEPLHME